MDYLHAYMKKLINRRCFLLCAFICCLAAVTAVGISQKIEILDYGIYTASGGSSVDADDSPSGNVLVGRKVKLVKQTEEIPAVLHTKFGFRFIMPEHLKKEQLRIVYLFPDIKNPSTGQTLNRFDADVSYGGKDGKDEPVGVLYDFSEKWELVPGEWTFQVFHGNQMLLQKKFTVLRPHQQPKPSPRRPRFRKAESR
jgi:hypothetical protein